MEYLFAAIAGYLFGSVPFGLILTRASGAGDVRQIGSGSIGATNVLRTGRKGLAAATVLLDAGKGIAAVLLAQWLWPDGADVAQVAAVAAVIGHCFPLWLGFRGGKGFATAAGILLALAWPVFLVCAAIWSATLALSRISSVSSMIAVVAAPFAAWLMQRPELIPALLAVAFVVMVQHRGNIARLMRGEEPRVGSKS